MADQNKRNAAPGTDNRRAYLSDNKSVDYKTPHTAKVAAAAEMKQDMAGGIEDGPTPTPEATVKTELAQAVRETEGDSTSVARSLAGAVAGMRRDDRREIRTKVRAATVNLPTKSTVGENSGSLLRARTYWECKTPFVFTVLRPQRSIVSIHGEEGADASREKEPSGTGEDSSSDVFSSERSSPEVSEQSSPRVSNRRSFLPLHHKQRVHSAPGTPVLRKATSRNDSTLSDAGYNSGASGYTATTTTTTATTDRNPRAFKTDVPSNVDSTVKKDVKAVGLDARRMNELERSQAYQYFPGFRSKRISRSSSSSGEAQVSGGRNDDSLKNVAEDSESGSHGEEDVQGVSLWTAAAQSSQVRCQKSNFVTTASDKTDTNRLQELDIVGERFESRFPWQKDVSVQCNLNLYLYHRSRVVSSGSSFSGDSLVASSCDSPLQNGKLQPFQYQLSLKGVPSTDSFSGKVCSPSGASGVARRTNFVHRQRPRSMGALENSRYQSELSRFRESGSRRGEVKADSRFVSSPSLSWRRTVFGFQEDVDSVSDLESILEYPDDSASDVSRQTSFTSFDTDDEIFRQFDKEPTARVPEEQDGRQISAKILLPSPCASPLMWTSDVNEDDASQDGEFVTLEDNGISTSTVRLRRTKQPPRRLSSGSLTSGSENEAEHEPSPPVARRGRRSAIYETKNCGDVSPTTLSPEHSPSNSCDEGEGASNIAERLRRRRSSVDLAMNIYPGDLLVQEHHKKLIKRNTIADFYAGRNGGPPLPPPPENSDASKKGRQPFSLLKLMKTRSKENLTRLDDIFRRLKPSEFKDNHLAAYKNLHWSDLIASTDKQNPPIDISDTERKRREAVWELFKSECVFLIDHLMVLKHCFMEPLKKVQVEGSLMFAEPQDIFGNLDELCYVSYTFCKDFLAALLKDMSVTDFGRTKVLIKAFQRDGAVFHTYCINYTNALSYLEKLRQSPEYTEFERWCEQDPRCNRLQLTDLLVAPMQHCTKLPLLLANVRKYTGSEIEKQMVTESIEKLETSLQQLEDKMKWIKNVERVQEIQRQIVWPAVTDLDPRSVIPDCLKATLSKQPCERLLTCTKRQLLHEGPLTLIETPKPIDIHVFIFDDLLLIAKVKKSPRRLKQSGNESGAKSPSGVTSDRASYVVFRQPLAMDRFTLHDIAPMDAAASGLKHVFVLVHISRFQQIIGVFTMQAPCDTSKLVWINQIKEAQEKYANSQASRQNSFKENKDPKSEDNDLRSEFRVCRSRIRRSSLRRSVPTKSRSMDAVFI